MNVEEYIYNKYCCKCSLRNKDCKQAKCKDISKNWEDEAKNFIKKNRGNR